MKVFHAKFGEGVVLTLEGAGQDARAQINFPRHGAKWLALSVAKLDRCPEAYSVNQSDLGRALRNS